MAEALRIYGRLVSARIRGDFQYRTSFALFTVAQFFVTFIDFLQILVVFGHIDRLAGWSVEEVAFLYGATSVAFHLSDVFVSEVEMLFERVRMGTFDLMLTRPVSPLLQLLGDEFALRRVGKIIQAGLVFGVALVWVDVDWTVGRIVMVPVMLAAGTVIFSTMWVLSASMAFWATEGNEVANAFTYGGHFMTQYPLGVYARWLRRMLGFVIPVAFVNYFPALYVLGRDDTLGAPSFFRFMSPLVAGALVLISRAAWQTGIRHYRSTGS